MYENKLSIKCWAEEDRPREKLLLKGKANLTDAELLAILISSGTRELTAVELAKIVLQKANNSLSELNNFSVSELMQIKGIGEAKAIAVISALELARRIKVKTTDGDASIKTSEMAYDRMKHQFEGLKHEEFWVLYLNRSNKLISKLCLSKGGISHTVVDVRILLNHAIKELATGIILLHNHPSGNLQPSEADKTLTVNIKEACKLMDITLLDHIIFGHEAYFSFENNGLL